MPEKEKIELKATLKRKKGIKLTDQHGRELKLHDPRYLSLGQHSGMVLVDAPELESDYPWDKDGEVRLIFRISVPVEIVE